MLAFVVPFILPLLSASPFVRAVGTQLTIGDQVIQPSGVNLGNYFVPEPYMMGGGKSSEGLRTSLVALAGNELKFAAWRRSWLDHFIEQADIKRIKSLGFNTVRVPLDWRDWVDASGKPLNVPAYPAPAESSVGVRYLDRLMDWCDQEGVYVMPDMHVTPDTIDSNAGNIFVSSESEANPNLELVKAAWTSIASRYRRAPHLLGYDLLNEPRGYVDSKLRPTYVQIRNAIRKQDPEHLIIVEPNVYSDLGDPADNGGFLGTPIDQNMLLSPHFYGGEAPESIAADGAKKGRKFLNWEYAQRFKVPILVGETGENDNDWANKMVQLWKRGSEGITAGTIYWTYKKPGDSVRCLVSVPWVEGWDRISKFLGGGAMPEDGFALMLEQASKSGFQRERLRVDVVDSLLRDYSKDGLLPFSKEMGVIPGLVRSTQYDLGAAAFDVEGQGAYFTHSKETVTYQIRNDRVGTAVADGGSIGFLMDGDWQKYTVKTTPGVYRVFLRYAAPTGGAVMDISIDGGESLRTSPLTATGGWDRFQEAEVGRIKVDKGTLAVLKLKVVKAGLNYSAVRFEAVP